MLCWKQLSERFLVTNRNEYKIFCHCKSLFKCGFACTTPLFWQIKLWHVFLCDIRTTQVLDVDFFPRCIRKILHLQGNGWWHSVLQNVRTISKHKLDWHFSPFIAQGCNNVNCMNGGACIPDGNGNFDRCNCVNGWTGDFCQIGKITRFNANLSCPISGQVELFWLFFS